MKPIPMAYKKTVSGRARPLVYLLGICFFAQIPLFGGEASENSKEGMSIIFTDCGKEILQQAFQTLSRILYGDGEGSIAKTFQGLIRISLAVGAFSALLLAFFRQKFEPLIKTFLFPALIIINLLLVPSTLVRIQNFQEEQPGIEIRVPLFLGKFSALASYFVYQLHQTLFDSSKIEFSWRSALSNQTEPFSLQKYIPSPPERDMASFCHQCVFYDTLFGLYSKQELLKTPNLMALFQKTAKHRHMEFRGKQTSCREAFGMIQSEWEALNSQQPKRENRTSASHLFSSIPTKEQAALIESQLFAIRGLIHAFSLLTEEKPSIATAIAASLIALGPFLQASLMILFPLVLLFSLLVFGLRALLQWARLILWSSLWPIFLGTSELFLQALWNLRKTSAFGSSIPNPSLEVFLDLAYLYPSMETTACFCFATPPILFWFFLKVAASKAVHFALPSQSALGESRSYLESPLPPLAPDPEISLHSRPLPCEASIEDAFKTVVTYARMQDQADGIQHTLSSIEGFTKKAADQKDPLQSLLSSVAAESIAPLESPSEERFSNTYPSTPSFGSWSET